MHWTCKHHGDDRPRRWVSITIRDAIENEALLTLPVRPIVMVYPNISMEVDVCFVDDADYGIFAEYAWHPTDLADCYPSLSLLKRTLPASTIVLVSRDRKHQRLNDSAFIFRTKNRLGSACAECLRIALRTVEQPIDLDFGIPRLSQSYNITP